MGKKIVLYAFAYQVVAEKAYAGADDHEDECQ